MLSAAKGELYERLLTVLVPSPDNYGGVKYTPTTPDSLTLTMKPPSGESVAFAWYEVENPTADPPKRSSTEIEPEGEGQFIFKFTPDESGTYYFTQKTTNPDETLVWQLEVGVAVDDNWTHVPPLAAYERFFGRPATDYSAEALSQATDLLLSVTGLSQRPGAQRPLDDRIYQRGIFAMAEAIELNRDTRTQPLSPYRSEQIGSYRYELIATAAMGGLPTGLVWWDQAVRFFATRSGHTGVRSNSIHVFDETLPEHLVSTSLDGQRQVVSPLESRSFRRVDGVEEYHRVRSY